MTARAHALTGKRVQFPSSPYWTPDEDAILRDLYQRKGAAAAAAAIGRSLNGVHYRASALGLFTHAHWTPVEDRRLTMLWGAVSVRSIARRLGRKKHGIYKRAGMLGLRVGCPRGMEYVTTAAARAGFSKGGLRTILKWAGVEIQLTTTKRPLSMVDADDVNEAVERWLATEYVNDAATRRGIRWHVLVRWLEESGREMPPRPPGKRRWRVPTETIDAVVASKKEGR